MRSTLMFRKFFDEKVAGVRAAMADVPSPTSDDQVFNVCYNPPPVPDSDRLTVGEVIAAVRISYPTMLPTRSISDQATEGGCRPH